MLTSGWTTTYTLGCQPVDYSEEPEAMRVSCTKKGFRIFVDVFLNKVKKNTFISDAQNDVVDDSTEII